MDPYSYKRIQDLEGKVRLLEAEKGAKDRELDWLRIENLHFLERIGKLLRLREGLERISRMGSSVEAQIARQVLGLPNPERGEMEPSPAERESRRWKAERGEFYGRPAEARWFQDPERGEPRLPGMPENVDDFNPPANPERGSSYDPERAAEWEAGEAQAEADYDAQQEKGNEV